MKLQFQYASDPDGSRAAREPLPPDIDNESGPASYLVGMTVPQLHSTVVYRDTSWQVVHVFYAYGENGRVLVTVRLS